MIIVIDAGHGGKDPGASANGLLEKNVTLKLALKAGAFLKGHYKCDVIYTRTKDVFVTLSERTKIANRAKANLFCSFHINSFGSTSKGFESYRYPGTKGKTLDLQKDVHSEVMRVLNGYDITDRGMKQQDLAVVRETSMPALLTESLFISNPNEAKLLKSESFLNEVAQAHAVGLAKAAGLQETSSSKQQASKKYFLKTGIFNSKSTAEKNAQMLKEKYGWHVDVKEA